MKILCAGNTLLLLDLNDHSIYLISGYIFSCKSNQSWETDNEDL